MLTQDQRDPAATPRLLLTLLAVALLWPGIRLAELNPLVLLQADNARTMGS
ncbi:MAG: ABC transporter permease, partial [Pseudomonas amygdali]